jgi:hypothetical protein
MTFSAPAFSDSATINQSGNDNYGAIEQQNADSSSASITQIGDRNHAGYAASGGSAATVGIHQTNATLTTGIMYQFGNDNVGSLEQQNTSNVYGRVLAGEAFASNNSYGQVSQTGTSHWGQTVQGAYRWNGSGWTFTATAVSNGAAIVDQSGTRQVARINQVSGDSNFGYTTQSGAWNESLIIQDGNSNFALVDQSGTGGAFADRNVVSIMQSGNSHGATATQSGMRNTALINQH